MPSHTRFPTSRWHRLAYTQSSRFCRSFPRRRFSYVCRPAPSRRRRRAASQPFLRMTKSLTYVSPRCPLSHNIYHLQPQRDTPTDGGHISAVLPQPTVSGVPFLRLFAERTPPLRQRSRIFPFCLHTKPPTDISRWRQALNKSLQIPPFACP